MVPLEGCQAAILKEEKQGEEADARSHNENQW